MTVLKSTSRWQGREGNQASEGSLRQTCVLTHRNRIRLYPWARKHNIPKPVWRTWERVNTAVVQGKIISLLGEAYLPEFFNRNEGTEPAKVRVKIVGVSQRREPRLHSRERALGSVMRSPYEL